MEVERRLYLARTEKRISSTRVYQADAGIESWFRNPTAPAVLQSQEHPCPPHPQFTRGNRSPLFLIRPALECHLRKILQISACWRTNPPCADLPSPPSPSLSGVNRPCLLEIVPQVRRLISGAAQFALRMQQAILLGLLLPLLARRSTAQSLSVNDLLKMSTAISPACRAGEWVGRLSVRYGGGLHGGRRPYGLRSQLASGSERVAVTAGAYNLTVIGGRMKVVLSRLTE